MGTGHEVYIDLPRSGRNRVRRVRSTDRRWHVTPQITPEIPHSIDGSRDNSLSLRLLDPLPRLGGELSKGRLTVHIIWPRIRMVVHGGVLLREERLRTDAKNYGHKGDDGFHGSTSV
jgi:hypothetical protein